MRGYIFYIEDLVGNALIELVEQSGKRTISMAQVNKYRQIVMSKLKEKGVYAHFVDNRNETQQFIENYSNIFTFNETDDNLYTTLNEGISTDFLRKKFRINLALGILPAFVLDNIEEIL